MDLFTYLMAKNDHNTSVKKDLFSYLLGKNQSGTYTDYSGTSLSINNTKKGKMTITLKGNTSQTGTPTPDNPIPVNVVSGDNEINVCGINLFNKNSSSVLGWINNNGNISPSSGIHTFDYIPCKPNTDYVRTTSESYGFYDENKEFISRGYGKALSTPSNAKYIRISVPDTNIDTEQLELGTTATTYEPYQEQNYSVNLGSMELCKIGNYQDYLYKDSGKWYKYSAIGKKVLDGSESWAFRTDWTLTGASVFRNSGYVAGEFETGTEGFSNYLIVVANIGSLSSYHHIRVTNSNGYGTQIFMDNDFLGITSGDTDAQKTAKLKTWLGNNNTTFYGIKPTPTTEEITDTTLISQLDALESAMSYKGQTNISQVNNDLPFEMEVKIKVGS